MSYIFVVHPSFIFRSSQPLILLCALETAFSLQYSANLQIFSAETLVVRVYMNSIQLHTPWIINLQWRDNWKICVI